MRKKHLRNYGPKATDPSSAHEDDGSGDEEMDVDVRDEAVEDKDKDKDNEEIQRLGSQTSQMSACDSHLDEELDEPEIPRLNDTTGHNTYDSDDAHSDYSRGSWYHVPTPPPSPPRSPSPDQANLQADAPELEDKDGFRNITAGDFHKFEQWYTEDHSGEDVEMFAESLTEEEVDSIIMIAIRQFGSLTQGNFEQIHYSYCDKVKLLSSYRLWTRIAKLSGVNPQNIDCCINSCHAFNGKFANEDICSTCKEPCYDFKGRVKDHCWGKCKC